MNAGSKFSTTNGESVSSCITKRFTIWKASKYSEQVICLSLGILKSLSISVQVSGILVLNVYL